MIKLNIAHPSKKKIYAEVDNVVIKLITGNVDIKTGHIPFLSIIKDGYVKYNNNQIKIKDGVVHLKDNNLYITYI